MAPNAFDYLAIQNTLASYCIAIDTKSFDQLGEFFTQDVQAKYPGPSFDGVKDVASLAKAIETSIKAVTTNHALSTQKIVISANGDTADATTYFTSVHFGKGKWQDHQLVAYGHYRDRLVLVEGKDGLPGSSGKWLIQKREVVLPNITGELAIMGG